MFMNYILFDPTHSRENLLPLTFTRPVSEIRIGILCIREKWEKHLNARISWQTAAYLSGKFPMTGGENSILINGSVLPDRELADAVAGLFPGRVLYSGDTILAVYPDNPVSEPLNEKAMAGFGKVEYKKDVFSIEYPWDIFIQNGHALEADFELLTAGRQSSEIPGSNTVIGDGKIFLEEGARVEGATLNTGPGPLYIGRNAEIMEGSLVRGPFALGENSTLKLGAKIYGPTTVGPHSKIGGEVNNSIILGFSNKAHDGFLGNSVIGEWCNLGADTNNSNLKNDYSIVRLWNYPAGRFIKSGLTFCGLIMGDHSKCGINTMFNTGTVVGVNANIYGSGFQRNFIPSFSWGGTQGLTEYRLEKALEVAARVMKRREILLSQNDRDILTEVFRITEKYRT
jgi:UDP-N-acetylglucosamine diphosphorylase/glucosamine-1-phosphate N-acetyltransferase